MLKITFKKSIGLLDNVLLVCECDGFYKKHWNSLKETELI